MRTVAVDALNIKEIFEEIERVENNGRMVAVAYVKHGEYLYFTCANCKHTTAIKNGVQNN
jgi:hypothetical protein